MKILFVLILGLATWVAIAQPRALDAPRETWFHAEITLRPAENGQSAWILPFDVVSIQTRGAARPNLYVANGDERLPLAYVGATPEGFERYELPYFPGELIWRREGRILDGFWLRPDRGEKYPLTLTTGRRQRFALPSPQGAEHTLAERYALRFHHPDQPANEGSP
ncbi:MAG: hypothetical protein ACO3CI_02995, partial [Schleiferiaceae bacterium]